MTLTERQVKGSWLQHVALLALRSFDWKWMQGVQWMNEKASRNQAYNPTTIEHVANVVTHGVWVLPSMLAGLELLQRARTWPQYFSALVYGAALILLFTVSTFFHSVFFYCNQNRHLKDALHRGDRAMIYVFIAASYFPWVTLQPMPVDEWVAELWWLVWLLASLGIAYQQVFHERYKCLETCVYLLMAVAPSLAMFYSTVSTPPPPLTSAASVPRHRVPAGVPRALQVPGDLRVPAHGRGSLPRHVLQHREYPAPTPH
ncbi:monocyte to macrophage differentiation factor 2 isoform X1 [Bacillus rossius redtenbacheri]|uniref:monocyte to macrophage differentiation factor 2 isoform X1 n=1 Tax=Bacillus rossius redtenbacheri TaxID=93214 RepID=UPI002FDCF0B3